MREQRREKETVPARQSQQAEAGRPAVIVWSGCPSSAGRWEHRLTRLGGGPVSVVTCLTVLQGVLGRSQGGQAVVLADFGALLRGAPAVEAPKLTGGAGEAAEAWALLRSWPTVAVARELTWQEAGPWLLRGAVAVVAWESEDEEVRAALDAARAGEMPRLHEMLQETLSGGLQSHRPRLGPALAQAEMTAREREVLLLACQGLSNAAIGERLFVSEANVRYHLNNLYRKLGTSNRLHLPLIALSRQWVALHELIPDLPDREAATSTPAPPSREARRSRRPSPSVRIVQSSRSNRKDYL